MLILRLLFFLSAFAIILTGGDVCVHSKSPVSWTGLANRTFRRICGADICSALCAGKVCADWLGNFAVIQARLSHPTRHKILLCRHHGITASRVHP